MLAIAFQLQDNMTHYLCLLSETILDSVYNAALIFMDFVFDQDAMLDLKSLTIIQANTTKCTATDPCYLKLSIKFSQ